MLILGRGPLESLIVSSPRTYGKLWRNLATELTGRLARTNDIVDHYVDIQQVLAEHPTVQDLLARL